MEIERLVLNNYALAQIKMGFQIRKQSLIVVVDRHHCTSWHDLMDKICSACFLLWETIPPHTEEAEQGRGGGGGNLRKTSIPSKGREVDELNPDGSLSFLNTL